MTRKSLIETLRECSVQCGYAFGTGFEYRIASEAKEFPAAWLLPPKLSAKEGNTEGIKHYSVTLKLICLCRDRSQSGREELWARMEDDALLILSGAGERECVRSVENIRYSPEEHSVTVSGDISLTASAVISMSFNSCGCGCYCNCNHTTVEP